jgi:transcriptional regulator with XRE-family HTH domain
MVKIGAKADKRWKQNTKIHPILVPRFASNLKRERDRRKLSQDTFADKAGITAAYVSMLEAGLRSPSLEIVETCSRALGMDPAALLKEG